MKNKPFPWLLTFLPALALFAGCSLFGSNASAPSALEERIYTIQTNVAVSTLVQTNAATNAAGVVTLTPQTNFIVITNYDYSLATNAANLIQTGGAVGNIFAPGMGTLGSLVLTSLFGLWGTLRSRKSNQASVALAQIIETAKEVIAQTPQGAQLSAAFTNWMQKHQTDAGVIQAVAALVDNTVDPDAAKGAASQLLALAGLASSTAVAPPATPAAAAPAPGSSPAPGPLS
jgi:hypothetical protein